MYFPNVIFEKCELERFVKEILNLLYILQAIYKF